MSRTGRPTNAPKNFRIELRFSETEREMLETCAEIYKLSKAEVCRRGLKMMYNAISYEKRLQEERADWEVLLTSGDKIRIRQIHSDVYGKAYQEAYDEKYAELILNPSYKRRSEVITDAKIYAEKVATATVERAINDFLEFG
ncbi:MAG: hypothetical protein LLG02_08160 [Pelosinus sp.]|nr:hypothetical protein [Pelosinus sp.]